MAGTGTGGGASSNRLSVRSAVTSTVTSSASSVVLVWNAKVPVTSRSSLPPPASTRRMPVTEIESGGTRSSGISRSRSPTTSEMAE